jgi:hypothetical protein
MKKIFLILSMLFSFILPAKADVMPYYISSINSNSIGVYQVSHDIKIYKEPNENSPQVVNVYWDSKNYECLNIAASNLFVVFLPQRDLGFIQVLDENEDETWVKVLYDKNANKVGWIKKEDDYRFLPWRIFFSWYGHKYGLYYMKDSPETTKAIYGSTEDDAKVIGRISAVPQKVNVTSIRGNWALINAYDIDQITKIGWIKWRDINGEIYLFPNMK